MKTKEEVIREAWGEYYESVKDKLDENGYILSNSNNYPNLDMVFDGFAYNKPKSLQGIEDNNGWIKLNGIANEIDYDGDIFIYNKYGNIELLKEEDFLPINYATHYQPITKPNPPLHD